MTGQALERAQPVAPVALSDREMRSIEFQARAIIALDKRLEIKDSDGRVTGVDKEKGLALAITLYSLGLPVTVTNAKKLHLIGDEVVESSQLLVGLLAMHGHEVRVIEEGDERAVVEGRRFGKGAPHRVIYTIDQARRSGALDEWVEKWEKTQSGKKYPVRYFLIFEGEPNEVAPEPWARTAIERGQVKRYDAWHKYRSDMLVNRAVRRLAKRMGGDALLGGGLADDERRIQPRDDDIDGEVLGEEEPPVDPPVDLSAPEEDDEDDEAAALRNERSKIHAASSRIPPGTWRQLWAKQWRETGLPAAHELGAEQLEPARLVTRQYLALAALDSVGASAEAARHALVREATGGETESTKALTAAQLGMVLAACRAEAERQEVERLQAEADAMEAEHQAQLGDYVDDDDPGRPF